MNKIRDKIDSIRKMKRFNMKTDEVNVRELSINKKKVEYTSSLITRYQNSSKNAIYDFNDMIEETKDFKRYQLLNLTKLEASAPDPKAAKNLEMQYYQDMEPYELLCREVLKSRIKQVLMVNYHFSNFKPFLIPILEK